MGTQRGERLQRGKQVIKKADRVGFGLMFAVQSAVGGVEGMDCDAGWGKCVYF